MNGIIIIDKPAQWTSHDVVAKLRGVLGQKRIGHGGTLDPMATGVLPIFVGRATRAVEFCENAEKEYIAGIKFGIVTDTQDITGKVLNTSSAHPDAIVTIDELKAVLPRFLGPQRQTPPMYSAIKQNGQKLYDLARRGIEVDRPARDIEIFTIEPCHPDFSQNPDDISDYYLRISCSKGTYIRTLCYDIGAALGCGAAMSYLRRTKAGVFTIDMAHPLDAVILQQHTKTLRRGDPMQSPAEELLLPIDTIFSQYPSITLCDVDVRKVKNGTPLSLYDYNPIADGAYRFYSKNGDFLLLGEVDNTKIRGKVRTIKSFYEV